MTAWDISHDGLTEFRLDRMTNVVLHESESADRNEVISEYRYEENKAVSFGRFNGDEVSVTLAAPADKVEIITDRFGDAATISADEDGEVKAYVKVCKSEQFFGWIAGMGKAVRIVAPRSLVEEYRSYLKYLLED